MCSRVHKYHKSQITFLDSSISQQGTYGQYEYILTSNWAESKILGQEFKWTSDKPTPSSSALVKIFSAGEVYN